MKLVNSYFGPEMICEPGESVRPVGCPRHSEHFWCKVCQGFYGVPHDRVHDDPLHVDRSFRDCACRPCTERRAEVAARRSSGGGR